MKKAITAICASIFVAGLFTALSAQMTSFPGSPWALGNNGTGVYNVQAYRASGDGLTVNTTYIQSALDAANAAGGGLVFIPSGTYLTCELTFYSNVHIMGASTNSTILKLASGCNSDVLKSYQFDSLTGTNSTGGVSGWQISNISINGNKAQNASGGYGLRQYGFDYKVNNVAVYNAKQSCWYSEWSATNTTAPVPNSMEAHVNGLKVHNCDVDGIVWSGPHDSNWVNVESYENISKGVWFKNGANGTNVVNGHVYAFTQDYAWYIEAVNITLTGSVGETAKIANVLVGANSVSIVGGTYYAIPSASQVPSDGCIKIGDGTHTNITHVQIDTLFSGCTTGAINFASDGGSNVVKGKSYQTTGTVSVGTPSPATLVELLVNGGGTGGFYNYPVSGGTSAFSYNSTTLNLGPTNILTNGYGASTGLRVPSLAGSPFSRASLLNVNFVNSKDTVTYGVPGNGTAQHYFSDGGVAIGSSALTLSLGALGMSKITASASAPGAAGAKLEVVCGTNAGSAKLVMYAGTSGTAVTVVDNVGTGVTGC